MGLTKRPCGRDRKPNKIRWPPRAEGDDDGLGPDQGAPSREVGIVYEVTSPTTTRWFPPISESVTAPRGTASGYRARARPRPCGADLAGALRHRHEHDVHDADPAHEQGYGGDGARRIVITREDSSWAAAYSARLRMLKSSSCMAGDDGAGARAPASGLRVLHVLALAHFDGDGAHGARVGLAHPGSLRLAVVRGTRMTSSWSWPRWSALLCRGCPRP